jgi:hypothetical protein
MAARFGLAIAVLSLLLGGAVQAQQYQRLHVRSITLASDTPAPQLEQPFHVTVAIQVAEDVSELSNVFLPTFFGAEELGDLHQISHSPLGTTYRETLTLVAHTRGTLWVSPAYLDAIDARDGKPKRFTSNSLRLLVGGGPVSDVWEILRRIALVAIDLLLLASVVFVVIAIFWRRRQSRLEVQEVELDPPVEEPIVQSLPKDPVEEAMEHLRARRDRSAVLGLRAVLWGRIGAADGETLSDVLRRPGANDPQLRRLLTPVERAAFIDDSRLHEAIEEVLCSQR